MNFFNKISNLLDEADNADASEITQDLPSFSFGSVRGLVEQATEIAKNKASEAQDKIAQVRGSSKDALESQEPEHSTEQLESPSHPLSTSSNYNEDENIGTPPNLVSIPENQNIIDPLKNSINDPLSKSQRSFESKHSNNIESPQSFNDPLSKSQQSYGSKYSENIPHLQEKNDFIQKDPFNDSDDKIDPFELPKGKRDPFASPKESIHTSSEKDPFNDTPSIKSHNFNIQDPIQHISSQRNEIESKNGDFQSQKSIDPFQESHDPIVRSSHVSAGSNIKSQSSRPQKEDLHPPLQGSGTFSNKSLDHKIEDDPFNLPPGKNDPFASPQNVDDNINQSDPFHTTCTDPLNIPINISEDGIVDEVVPSSPIKQVEDNEPIDGYDLTDPFIAQGGAEGGSDPFASAGDGMFDAHAISPHEEGINPSATPIENKTDPFASQGDDVMIPHGISDPFMSQGQDNPDPNEQVLNSDDMIHEVLQENMNPSPTPHDIQDPISPLQESNDPFLSSENIIDSFSPQGNINDPFTQVNTINSQMNQSIIDSQMNQSGDLIDSQILEKDNDNLITTSIDPNLLDDDEFGTPSNQFTTSLPMSPAISCLIDLDETPIIGNSSILSEKGDEIGIQEGSHGNLEDTDVKRTMEHGIVEDYVMLKPEANSQIVSSPNDEIKEVHRMSTVEHDQIPVKEVIRVGTSAPTSIENPGYSVEEVHRIQLLESRLQEVEQERNVALQQVDQVSNQLLRLQEHAANGDSELVQEVVTLKEKMKVVQLQSDKIKREAREGDDKSRFLEKRLQDLELQLEESSMAKMRACQEVEELNEQLQTFHRDAQQMQNVVAKLNSEKSTQQNQNEQVMGQLARLQDAIATAEADAMNAKELSNTLQATNAKLEKKIKQLEAKVDKNKDNSRLIDAAVDKAREEMEEELNSIVMGKDEKISKLQKTIETKKYAEANLLKEKDSILSQLEAAQAEIIGAKKKEELSIQKLQREVEIMKAEHVVQVEIAQANVGQDNRDKEELQRSLRSMESVLEAEIMKLEDRAQKYVEQISTLQQENDKLRIKTEELYQELAQRPDSPIHPITPQAMEQSPDVESKIRRLEEQVEEGIQLRHIYQRDAEAYANELEDVQKQRRDLESQLDNLMSRLEREGGYSNQFNNEHMSKVEEEFQIRAREQKVEIENLKTKLKEKTTKLERIICEKNALSLQVRLQDNDKDVEAQKPEKKEAQMKIIPLASTAHPILLSLDEVFSLGTRYLCLVPMFRLFFGIYIVIHHLFGLFLLQFGL